VNKILWPSWLTAQIGEPTEAFLSFWCFIQERFLIFLARLAGKAAPWTENSILGEYKFTNTFRVLDRESQTCVKIANSSNRSSAEEAFFRVLLFKIFNLTSTWDLLCDELGEEPLLSTWNPNRYGEILTRAQKRGQKIFSRAFILWADQREGSIRGPGSKTRMWLSKLDQMLRDNVPGSIVAANTIEHAVKVLSGYDGIEDFTAQQYATDFSYTRWFQPTDSETFILPGPGSIDGIAKCFGRTFTKEACSIIIQLMRISGTELSQIAIGKEPPTLRSFGIDRPMDLIDYQSAFCEVDKYSRVAHRELNYLSKQKRYKIKTPYLVNPGEVRLLPKPVFPNWWQTVTDNE
jgi:alpha-glutamyl/putrescinyl thymine pyrophosphorylase clade 1